MTTLPFDKDMYKAVSAKMEADSDAELTTEEEQFLADAGEKARDALREKLGEEGYALLESKFDGEQAEPQFYQGLQAGLLQAVDLLNKVQTLELLPGMRVVSYSDINCIRAALLGCVLVLEDKGLVQK